ncbi:NAD(P)-binding protein [Chytriomyces cf. hyalinus JEL632]|nr:NAD(P)-binding protein [Chytriomyces cf. hyalinus JEL632]
MGFLLNALYSQLFVTPPAPTHDFSGQTVIIIGANIGLGLEAARHIARLNVGHLVLGVRTASKGEAAKKDIVSSTGIKEESVSVRIVDLSSNKSVITFSNTIQAEFKKVDALLLNASILPFEFALNEDGVELGVATNVIGTFLLALLMLPLLRSSAAISGHPVHLSITASEVHGFTTLPEKKHPHIFTALNAKDSPDFADRYNVTKLMQVLLARELAKSVDSDKVILNFLNPGLCHSNLSSPAKGFSSFMLETIKYWVARTTEVGSRTLVHALTIGKESHGQYLSSCKVEEPAPFVLSAEGATVQKRLWDELSDILESARPGILSNIA